MGFNLSAKNGLLKLSGEDLSKFLNGGILYGWEPMGTKNGNPDFLAEEWSGDYLSNSFQIMVKEDIVNLIFALEQFLKKEGDPATINLLAEFIQFLKGADNITIS
jgi:hypothetical protein